MQRTRRPDRGDDQPRNDRVFFRRAAIAKISVTRARYVLSDERKLYRFRERHPVAFALALCGFGFSKNGEAAVRRRFVAGDRSRDRLVGSMVVLAMRLSSDHGDGHGAVSVSALSRAHRYAG